MSDDVKRIYRHQRHPGYDAGRRRMRTRQSLMAIFLLLHELSTYCILSTSGRVIIYRCRADSPLSKEDSLTLIFVQNISCAAFGNAPVFNEGIFLLKNRV